MNRLAAVACVFLSAAVLAPTALAGEADLGEWARARWEAYLAESPQALAAAVHATGGTVFMGTTWDGFYYGEDTVEAWSALQEHLELETVEVRAKRLLPNAGLVWAELTFVGTERETGEPRELSVASALVFDKEGHIAAEDLIVLSGLPTDSPAPVWDGSVEEAAYSHHLHEGRTGMDLWWRNGLAVLLVGVRAPGSGWVSVGFDPQRMMQGADFIIGALTEAGLVIEDHHGHAPTGHRRDDHEDILAAGGQVVNGATTVEFVIPLDSGDPQDNMLVPGESHTVLLAYHRSSTSLTVRHTARGDDTITLDE